MAEVSISILWRRWGRRRSTAWKGNSSCEKDNERSKRGPLGHILYHIYLEGTSVMGGTAASLRNPLSATQHRILTARLTIHPRN